MVTKKFSFEFIGPFLASIFNWALVDQLVRRQMLDVMAMGSNPAQARIFIFFFIIFF